MAARGACATTDDPGCRVSPDRIGRYRVTQCGGVPHRPQRDWLRRRPELNGRVPLAGKSIRSSAGTDSRLGPPPRGRDRHGRHPAGCARGESCNSNDPNRLRRRYRPVQLGLVASLAHPGGNVTGTYFLATEITAKRLRLLNDMVPQAVRVAVLVNPVNTDTAKTTLRDAQEAAPAMGLKVQPLNATTIGELDSAFETMRRERARCAHRCWRRIFPQPPHTICHPDSTRQDTSDFSSARFCRSRRADELNGADIMDSFRQVGVYTGKILNGAKPAELPVLQSTKFEFVINRHTARALGIDVPPGVLSIADAIE